MPILKRKTRLLLRLKNYLNQRTILTTITGKTQLKELKNYVSEFLKTGSVPRKLSNNNWNDFKSTLRNFNTTKNNYYKSLKGSQQDNLDEKLKLIQTAKDNMLSEDWDIAVALFKKLQEDWKKKSVTFQKA